MIDAGLSEIPEMIGRPLERGNETRPAEARPALA